MQHFAHYIWDFDGTLFDTYPYLVACFMRALAGCGVAEDETDVHQRMLLSISDAYAHFEEKHGLGEEFSRALTQHMGAESIRTSQPFPGAVALCRLIADSGRRNYLYTHRGESAHAFLRDAGLAPCFAQVVTSADGFARKPSPEALLHLIGRHGMNRDEALMVGDRAIDIQCGANAGIRTCFISNGVPNAEVDADHTFESLLEMYRSVKDTPI